jgi:membrane associated rhomboid family serine protease
MSDPLGGLQEPAPQPRPPPELQKRPFLPSTWAILGTLAAVFVAEGLVGHDASVESGVALMRMGALYLPAVLDGDFWRVGSYAFLHIGWMHLLMNSWSLWVLAPQLELVFGSNLLLGFFSATAIAGGLSSIAWTYFWVVPHGGPAAMAAGASGGVFGLFGVTIALIIRIHHRFSPQARRAIWRSVFLSLLLNLGIAFVAPVDNAAHLGGLISGVLIGLIAPFLRGEPRPWHAPVRWVIVGFALLLASMQGAAFARAVHPRPRTLRGPGVEAQVDGQLIPFAPGAAWIPGAAEIQIHRQDEPLQISSDQDAVHIGDRTWVRERMKDAKGMDHLALAAMDGPGRLMVDLFCDDEFCRGAAGDRMVELTARTIRPAP